MKSTRRTKICRKKDLHEFTWSSFQLLSSLSVMKAQNIMKSYAALPIDFETAKLNKFFVEINGCSPVVQDSATRKVLARKFLIRKVLEVLNIKNYGLE